MVVVFGGGGVWWWWWWCSDCCVLRAPSIGIFFSSDFVKNIFCAFNLLLFLLLFLLFLDLTFSFVCFVLGFLKNKQIDCLIDFDLTFSLTKVSISSIVFSVPEIVSSISWTFW